MSVSLRWVVDNYRPFFQAVKAPIDSMLQSFTAALAAVPPLVLLVVVALVAWQIAGARLAVGLVATLLFVGFIGVWPETMLTLAIVLTALIFSLTLGIPLGIWASRSETLYSILRPLLDAMQTIPAFVYLVPVVMLFGIGNVPGVIVTVIFAVAPVIRLTYLGMNQVPGDVVEAMRAFGSTESQLLWKAQLPLALPTIMAGVNQTLMMSLSMVVIASMIAVGGLGQMVLRGIGRLDIGIATVGGLGIVALAIVLDRLTQALAKPRKRGEWLNSGPVGLVRSIVKPSRADAALPSSAVKN
jgi:glycine betaine/proline transport system permease protein